MVSRRVLLPMLVVVFALLGPGQALATPAVDARRDASVVAPAVTAPRRSPPTPTATRSRSGSTRRRPGARSTSLYRPRGGPWGAHGGRPRASFPRAWPGSRPARSPSCQTAQFVVAWDADRTGNGAPVLRAATRSPSGSVDHRARPDLNTSCGVNFARRERRRQRHGRFTRHPAVVFGHQSRHSSAPRFDPPQTVEHRQPVDDFAVAPDGSAVAVDTGALRRASLPPCA